MTLNVANDFLQYISVFSVKILFSVISDQTFLQILLFLEII